MMIRNEMGVPLSYGERLVAENVLKNDLYHTPQPPIDLPLCASGRGT
jgi:hypothetical protein